MRSATLLDAVKSDREGNAVLTIALAGGTADAVVTAKPMQTGDSDVAAFVILQIPMPSAERFVDPAVIRDMLLRDTFAGIDDTLDFSDLAKKLMAQLVPAFCTSAELLVLESLIGDNEMPDARSRRDRRATAPVRRERPAESRLARRLPDRRDPPVPGGVALRALPRVGPAGARAGAHRGRGAQAGQGLAAQAGRQPAVRRVDAAAARRLQGHRARALLLLPRRRAPAASTATTWTWAWSSPLAPPCSSTTRPGTTGSTPPR